MLRYRAHPNLSTEPNLVTGSIRDLLSVKELSVYLRVSSCTVYRLVDNAEIPSIRLGGLGIRFRRKDVDEWLEKGAKRPAFQTLQLEDNKRYKLTSTSLHGTIDCHETKGGTGEMAKAKSKARFNCAYGAIYPRETSKGDVRWYLDYRDARGKRVQKVARHATSREEAVLALKSAVLNELNKDLGIPSSSAHQTFKEFAETYLTNYAKVNKRSWRDDQYRLDAHMVPYFGHLELREITPMMIEQYKAERLKSEVTRSTVNREITLLKRMLGLAVDWGFLEGNPAKKVKLFSEKDAAKARILMPEEESRLFEACPSYLKPIIAVALNTGMRRGEIFNLKWSQVDLVGRTVRVVQTKSGEDREIPLNELMYNVLAALKAADGRQELVFPNPETGKPYTEVKKSFKQACKTAEIEGLRFHDLRHTFASRLMASGADIETVRDLLGHFSVKVTQRYTHSGRSQKVAAVERLAQKSGQKPEKLLHSCYTN